MARRRARRFDRGFLHGFGGRRSAEDEVGSQEFEAPAAQAFDGFELLHRGEGLGLAHLDDPLGFRLADSRQEAQFEDRGGIEVNDPFDRLGVGKTAPAGKAEDAEDGK